ncbi:MAG TPA: hypothetical protein VGJ26_17200 [Pirellulales bacterium]|jgi:hypothetical protein
METIKRLSDVEPGDLVVVERLFGQRIERTEGNVLVLKTVDPPPTAGAAGPGGELPNWCNVLEEMSDHDLAELNVTIANPVRLAKSPIYDGP